MMKKTVIIDENLSPRLLYELIREYNVILPRRGQSDEELLNMAIMLDCYLITRDRGFPQYPKLVYLKSTSIPYIKQRLRECQT